MARGQRRYQVFLKSQNGQPIDVFLIADPSEPPDQSSGSNLPSLAQPLERPGELPSSPLPLRSAVDVPQDYYLAGLATDEGLSDFFP